MSPFCDCTEDGYCQRYQRDMRGRFREICQGVNCDLGTAAAFREQWAQEAGTAVHLNPKAKPIPLLLKTDQAPGDAVVMTAAIYSLHRAHPGKYRTAVMSEYPEVFHHNPDVCNAGPGPAWGESLLKSHVLQMHYPAIHQSNERGIHFMQAYCEHLGRALGVHVPLLTNRPHLYFDPPYREPYNKGHWIVCSGGKRDLTNKLWGHHNYEDVLNILRGKVRFIQVGAAGDDHKMLSAAAHNIVGTTNLRQLFRFIRSARGVLCNVSLPMHVAAALNKPCVVIAGGREPVQWNAYPRQHYLHTVGALPCSSALPQGQARQGEACWRSRTVPLGDSTTLDEHPCLRPIELTYAGVSITKTPECMTLIKPQQVADLILKIDQQYEVPK